MDNKNKAVLDKLNKSFAYQEIPIKLEDDEFITSRLALEFQDIYFIGSGGFGNVLGAKKIKFDKRLYALKVIASVYEDKKSVDEIMHLSELEHENVVKYYTAWEQTVSLSKEDLPTPSKPSKSGTLSAYSSFSSEYSETTSGGYSDSGYDLKNEWRETPTSPTILYIQQELCETTLRNLIDNYTLSNNIELSLKLLCQILDGVCFIHSKKVIHRDIKPSNIFIKKTTDGEYQVKIGDFGLATFFEPVQTIHDGSITNTFHTTYVGTSYYVAPEVKISSRYDEKCDLYSLGITVFEMFYHPFITEYEKTEKLDLLVSHLSDKILMYPNDFGNEYDDEDVMRVKTLLQNLLQLRPQDRRISGITKLELSVGKKTEKHFVNKITNRFYIASKIQKSSSKSVVAYSFDINERKSSFYQLIIAEVLKQMKDSLTSNGLIELPGHFDLHIKTTKVTSDYLEFNLFGYDLIKSSNQSFFKINEASTNFRCFAFGAIENRIRTKFDNYGAVDFTAPINYAPQISAEILLLMKNMKDMLPISSNVKSFVIKISETNFKYIFDPRLSYRPEFFSDGLIFALQYKDPESNYSHTIFAGGRYDSYLNSKRKGMQPLCAFGFNIFMETLVYLHQFDVVPEIDYVLVYSSSYEKEAFYLKNKLQSLNYPTVIYYEANISEENLLAEFQTQKQFKYLLKITDEENVVFYNRKENVQACLTKEIGRLFPPIQPQEKN